MPAAPAPSAPPSPLRGTSRRRERIHRRRERTHHQREGTIQQGRVCRQLPSTSSHDAAELPGSTSASRRPTGATGGSPLASSRFCNKWGRAGRSGNPLLLHLSGSHWQPARAQFCPMSLPGAEHRSPPLLLLQRQPECRLDSYFIGSLCLRRYYLMAYFNVARTTFLQTPCGARCTSCTTLANQECSGAPRAPDLSAQRRASWPSGEGTLHYCWVGGAPRPSYGSCGRRRPQRLMSRLLCYLEACRAQRRRCPDAHSPAYRPAALSCWHANRLQGRIRLDWRRVKLRTRQPAAARQALVMTPALTSRQSKDRESTGNLEDASATSMHADGRAS